MNKEREKTITWLKKKIDSQIVFDSVPDNEDGWHEIKRESVVKILDGLIPMLKTEGKPFKTPVFTDGFTTEEDCENEAIAFTTKKLRVVGEILPEDYKMGYKEGIEHYLVYQIEKYEDNVDDRVLPPVNFCTMPQEKLHQLLEFLNEADILKVTNCEEKYVDGKCIEKRWDYYSSLIVTPQKIVAIGTIALQIMTVEKFTRMRKLFL